MKTERPLLHRRLKEVYNISVREDEEGMHLTRKRRVSLARFRAGHHTELRSGQKMVGKSDTAQCRLCGAEEESTRHVWMECPEMEDLRWRYGLSGDMAELVENPVSVETLITRMLRRLDA